MGEDHTEDPPDSKWASGADQAVRRIGTRDAEQASLFADIFREEVADLRHRLRDAERNWERRQNRSQQDLETPDGLVRLREQLGEAQGLLASLRSVPKRAPRVAGS
jgi:O-succinylbenzoate synthase